MAETQNRPITKSALHPSEGAREPLENYNASRTPAASLSPHNGDRAIPKKDATHTSDGRACACDYFVAALRRRMQITATVPMRTSPAITAATIIIPADDFLSFAVKRVRSFCTLIKSGLYSA